MSESLRDRAATLPGPAKGPGLLDSLAPLLLDWLPRRRWFAGKGNPITGLAPVSAAELLPIGGESPGLLHLLIEVRQPGPVADCYQLLLGTRALPHPALSTALIGTPAEGPLRDLAVYDALEDPRLSGVLLERLRLPGRLGALRFLREPGAAIPTALHARPLGAEQSNSSVVYGNSLILKVFRRVFPGSNPDLELPLALSRAGCARVPTPLAWFESTALSDSGEAPATLGVLQPFLAGAQDGWRLALDTIAQRGDFLPQAYALGQATAEVHTALSAELPVTMLRRPQIEHLTAVMSERLEETVAAVPAMRPHHAALAASFETLAELGRGGRSWPAQRIHGDLHLGQLLRSSEESGWSLIDFEGEPARPLHERTRPQPTARDMAGMLRSFDYAAHAASAPSGWAARAGDAYCEGYAASAGTDPRTERELLQAFITDKAVYEVLYEARHRPDWLHVPLDAIHQLTTRPAKGGSAQ